MFTIIIHPLEISTTITWGIPAAFFFPEGGGGDLKPKAASMEEWQARGWESGTGHFFPRTLW